MGKTIAPGSGRGALEIADARVPVVKGRMDPAAVEALHLQVELCKWLAARLYPEMYGDKA
jgi:hypothetical protein